MPPEGYEKRRLEKLMNDFLQGRSNYKRLSAKEQVERIEMGKVQKYLSKKMLDHVKEYSN